MFKSPLQSNTTTKKTALSTAFADLNTVNYYNVSLICLGRVEPKTKACINRPRYNYGFARPVELHFTIGP